MFGICTRVSGGSRRHGTMKFFTKTMGLFACCMVLVVALSYQLLRLSLTLSPIRYGRLAPFAARVPNSTSQMASAWRYVVDSVVVSRGTLMQRLTDVATEEKIAAFQPTMDGKQVSLLFDIAEQLCKVCRSSNVTMFLYGGSLLGSYRHHDIIPWDDDIDVFVNISHRKALLTALSELAPKYVTRIAGPRIKFFSERSSKTASQYPWKWPYVDVHFFKENATHIMDHSRDFHTYKYPKAITFPLHKRPLGHLYLPAPFDSYATLKATYRDLHKCSTYHYSHKYEMANHVALHLPCDKLKNKFSFVHRTVAKGGVLETLMMNERVLDSLLINEPDYAVPSAYTLLLP